MIIPYYIDMREQQATKNQEIHLGSLTFGSHHACCVLDRMSVFLGFLFLHASRSCQELLDVRLLDVRRSSRLSPPCN